LNSKIDEASGFAEGNDPVKALNSFISLANSIDKAASGLKGLIYMNIITLSGETGNKSKAAEYYTKLKTSSIPRKDAYLKHLNASGISY